MLLSGQNLYRVTFKISGGQKVKEIELTRLVIAHSEKEAAAYIGGNPVLIQPIETDISLYLPNIYIKNGKAEGEFHL